MIWSIAGALAVENQFEKSGRVPCKRRVTPSLCTCLNERLLQHGTFRQARTYTCPALLANPDERASLAGRQPPASSPSPPSSARASPTLRDLCPLRMSSKSRRTWVLEPSSSTKPGICSTEPWLATASLAIFTVTQSGKWCHSNVFHPSARAARPKRT